MASRCYCDTRTKNLRKVPNCILRAPEDNMGGWLSVPKLPLAPPSSCCDALVRLEEGKIKRVKAEGRLKYILAHKVRVGFFVALSRLWKKCRT